MSDTVPVPEAHQFDRRSSDVNVAALAVQVRGLAGRVEVLEEQGRTTARDLAELKPLAQEVHSAVFGVEGEFQGIAGMARDAHAALFGDQGTPGMKQAVAQILEVIEMGRGFFRWLGRVATGAGKTSDWISKTIKRFWWLIALAISVMTFLKTGKWEIPVWPQ